MTEFNQLLAQSVKQLSNRTEFSIFTAKFIIDS